MVTLATPIATLAEHLEAGRFQPRDAAFAASLLGQARRRVLTPSQLYWVHELNRKAEHPDTPARGDPEKLDSHVRAVFELFARAQARGLQRPKIRLLTKGRENLVLSVAGTKSKYPGQVMLTDGLRFGSNRYFGRIDADGNLHPGKHLNDDVRELITRFAANPPAVAAEYGLLTGACCFCSRHLETPESVSVGYGPVCADQFGLPWGAHQVVAPFTPAGALQEPWDD